jgi:cation transport protein ChaC
LSDPGRCVSDHWVFGYGSLIFKADFPYLERRAASITGWERRFWQGSHDHRGTPEAPGRVVTLVPVSGAHCAGMAYRIDEHVFEHLDYREKNGYLRIDTRLTFSSEVSDENGDQGSDRVTSAATSMATVYIASEDNPAFLGPASNQAIASHIYRCHGPSGNNRDYLLELAGALRDLGTVDEHVFELEELLRQM